MEASHNQEGRHYATPVHLYQFCCRFGAEECSWRMLLAGAQSHHPCGWSEPSLVGVGSFRPAPRLCRKPLPRDLRPARIHSRRAHSLRDKGHDLGRIDPQRKTPPNGSTLVDPLGGVVYLQLNILFKQFMDFVRPCRPPSSCHYLPCKKLQSILLSCLKVFGCFWILRDDFFYNVFQFSIV